MNQQYCLVAGCRFSSTHLTCSHQCTRCKRFGHGQIECRNREKREELQQRIGVSNIRLPQNLYCAINNCRSSWSHTTSAHICMVCGEREHGQSTCPQNRNNQQSNQNAQNFYRINCPFCRMENSISVNQKTTVGHGEECVVCFGQANMFLPNCGHINICLECVKQMDVDKPHKEKQQNNNQNAPLPQQVHPSPIIVELANNQKFDYNMMPTPINLNEFKNEVKNVLGDRDGKVVILCFGELGHHVYARRDSIGSEIETFMIAPDEWGQYGPNTNRVGELNNFVDGYTPTYPIDPNL
jgi:hypothetical protein